jgi:peptidoglycan/xylan/chitin deacetylase (PgdA/CDA1 family)
MTGRRFTLAGLKSAPQAVAISMAALVVLIAAVTSALVAPGPGGEAAAAGAGAGISGAGPGVPHPAGSRHPVTRPPAHRPAHSPAHIVPPAVPPVPASIQHSAEIPGPAVNITIDDGPDPRWTPQILDILKAHHVRATFCMVGPLARAHPDLVRRVVAEGHRLCDHSVHHDTTMDHKPFAYQKAEITDALQMILDASGGAPVHYYRAPGGAFTPASRVLAARLGLRPLGWNVDTRDFSRPGAAAILNVVKSEIHNGPTVLFHDGGGDRAQTVSALGPCLTWLGRQGYAFSFPKVD